MPRGLFAVRGRRQRARCRRWQTAKSLHIGSFFCFLLNPTIFITNIYDIYRYISQQTYKIYMIYMTTIFTAKCKHIRYPSNMQSSIIHSSITYVPSNYQDTCIVQRYKRNKERDKEHSIYASFRQVNEICKMKNKKVRNR